MPPTTKPFIIDESKDFLIIYKPPFVHSEKNKNSSNYSVSDWLGAKGELLNRLDLETSGILIASKNEHFSRYFKKISEEKKVKKSYLALIEGAISKVIKDSSFIGSKSRTAKTVKVLERASKKYRTQPAYTEIYPYAASKLPKTSVVKTIIFEGRRHQIRAVLSHRGHPLVGDAKYGSKMELEHFYLHAWRLEFPQEGSKKSLEFVAPVPEYFSKIIATY